MAGATLGAIAFLAGTFFEVVVFFDAEALRAGAFLAATFLAVVLAAGFLAGVFLAGAFFAADFLAGAFFAVDFLAGAFFAAAFFAGAFFDAGRAAALAVVFFDDFLPVFFFEAVDFFAKRQVLKFTSIQPEKSLGRGPCRGDWVG